MQYSLEYWKADVCRSWRNCTNRFGVTAKMTFMKHYILALLYTHTKIIEYNWFQTVIILHQSSFVQCWGLCHSWTSFITLMIKKASVNREFKVVVYFNGGINALGNIWRWCDYGKIKSVNYYVFLLTYRKYMKILKWSWNYINLLAWLNFSVYIYSICYFFNYYSTHKYIYSHERKKKNHSTQLQ